MKELVLLRHAKSSSKGPPVRDLDRPLSGRGRRAAARMAEWLVDAGCRPDLVLCSTASRTRETLSFLSPALGEPKVRYEGDLYLASAGRMLGRLRAVPKKADSVLLIGHNPGLQELVLWLIGNRPAQARERIATKFPTAALVRFEVDAASWRDLGSETARLVDCVYPRDFDPPAAG